MASTWTVARPMGVRPTRRAPSHRKCSPPIIFPRVEEAHGSAGFRIDPRNVRTLEAVAVRASQRQIVFHGLAAVLFGDDVVDLEGQRQRPVRHPAILAALGGPLPDAGEQLAIHWGSDFESNWRARDCITASKRPMCR